MLTCKVGENIINCFDGTYDKYQLKKWSDKNILICPDCGKSYEYCHGEVINPYFRHKEKSIECEQIYSEPETEEHIKGKQILYEWLINLQNNGIVSDVKLESYIPETKQRPDLSFICNGNKIVFEFQCTPIATEFIERHRLYQLAGIIDIWILGTDKYIKKSEINKNYKEKVIERYTNFYLDSDYKILIFSDICKLNLKDNIRIKQVNNYYNKNKRNLILNKLLVFDEFSSKYMININGATFYKENIILINEIMNNINNYSEEVIKKELELQENERLLQLNNAKCKSFIKKLFNYFEEKYYTKFNFMQYDCGFKCSKHYYQLKGLENYPIVDFYKIKYINNNPTYSYILNSNLEYDDINKIADYLKKDLEDIIKLNIKFNNIKNEIKEKRNNELIELKNKLSQYNNKPIYLIFLEDNKKVDVKFKMIHDYPDDIVNIGKVILNNLKFIDSKGAKEYVLMIPRKRIKESNGSSLFYRYYKVRNYKDKVREEFKELGINFLEI